jgi:transcriptional regulator with XRE-family HTH domain
MLIKSQEVFHMQIGEVIRKYRKERNLTQEEMANRLGVTAPAVNKWENANSLPDVLLLAPIARLLGISLDTLLSFREELTTEEIQRLVYEADEKLKSETYEEAFQWAKTILEQYPNCEELIWQLAVVFDARRIVAEDEIPDPEQYDDYIKNCYVRVLASENERTRSRAADALFGFYVRKEQYEKAEECLSYFSIQNPERKRKQADIYSKTGRIKEAYKTLEELLFSDYGMVCMVFHNLYMLAMQENDLEKAHMLVEKQRKLANVFDMGAYHEASCKLELATVEKDEDTVIEMMEEMLASIGKINDFRRSPLYEHMDFKDTREEFLTELRENLLACFQDEETYGFLKENKRWQELINRE